MRNRSRIVALFHPTVIPADKAAYRDYLIRVFRACGNAACIVTGADSAFADVMARDAPEIEIVVITHGMYGDCVIAGANRPLVPPDKAAEGNVTTVTTASSAVHLPGAAAGTPAYRCICSVNPDNASDIVSPIAFTDTDKGSGEHASLDNAVIFPCNATRSAALCSTPVDAACPGNGAIEYIPFINTCNTSRGGVPFQTGIRKSHVLHLSVTPDNSKKTDQNVRRKIFLSFAADNQARGTFGSFVHHLRVV